VIIIILAGVVFLTKDMSFLSRYLLRPLRELADDMESIAQLHIDAVSENKETDVDLGTSEIKHIRKTFEHMRKAILSWGKYVPWPVVQLMIRQNIEAELSVKEHEVTIFFSDIASFTSIVERIAPEESLLLLSKYFNEMSNVTDDHGGVVLEFIGDAILSIFGEPIQNPDHPTMAVRSTLKMLAVLRKMNEWSKERSLPEVNIRCGLHTGKVLVGNMGFNTRMKYGIVGEEANIPARLEELNKSYDTNFLISETTLKKLQPDTFITRPIDCVYLRRTPDSASEVIHQVVDKAKKSGVSDHPMWPAAKLHAEAMELYFERDFKQAAAKFENVSAMVHGLTREEDRPSLMMLERCESYISKPPPAQWQGVWDRGDELH
jgi:adenylate cyclase